MHIADASGQQQGAKGSADRVLSGEHQPVHASETFSFVANGSLTDVFPLFGADRERVWAPGWEPKFLWPTAPADREGMVFEIPHHGKVATWINTVFDPKAGRVQYVYVLPEVVSTVITLDLTARNTGTEVVVRYERTSLSPGADPVVKEMATHDRAAGAEWASQINAYLAESRNRTVSQPPATR